MITHVKQVTSTMNQLIENLLHSQSFEENYEIIQKSTICEQDVELYRHFNPLSYGRNLVFTCSTFEFILMCWKSAQESAIHDHAESDCIMRCVSGRFEEQLFEVESSKIKYVRSRIINAGDVTYINNDLGLHKLKNINDGESLALHFYFPGIHKCYVFNEEENSRKEVYSTFTSKFGLL
jgi:cysteine dioxygenase